MISTLKAFVFKTDLQIARLGSKSSPIERLRAPSSASLERPRSTPARMSASSAPAEPAAKAAEPAAKPAAPAAKPAAPPLPKAAVPKDRRL
eukprot:13294241-Alexandrium_andersonii.AAC.1